MSVTQITSDPETTVRDTHLAAIKEMADTLRTTGTTDESTED